jgi:2-polyprenyl-3-methyl-5-hydroxy-6-metoxy-1,4-benzoquinol methylase
MVKQALISKRYINDGISLLSLSDLQRQYIVTFLNDKRIKYNLITECPLCSYTNFVVIAHKDRYGMPLETAVCERCGLIFSLHQLDKVSTKIFYSEYYRPIYEGILNPTQDRWGSYYAVERGIPRFLKQGNAVVEIGAGGGWNLLKFKNKGFDHYGFDYDNNLIDFGKKQYGLNLMNGSIDEAINMGIKADYCILSHVLEHTINPINFLSKFKNILKDKSILKVTVPSANMLIIGGSGTGYDLLGTLQNAHNFLFDEFTLKYAAQKSGFGVYACNGEYIILRKDYFSDKTLESLKNRFDRDFRGAKVIKFLKLCEKFVSLKRYLIPSKIEPKLIYLYLIFKPIQLIKLFLTLKNPHLLDE